MTLLRLMLGASLALGLASPPVMALAAADAPRGPAAAAESDIEPEAIQALTRMSAYLGTLSTFEISANTTLDLVTADGQEGPRTPA